MTDVFDAKISCKKCGVEMIPTIVERNGFELRAVKCSECGDKIIHPADLNGLEHFEDLKGKTFSVKLRMVGNSHAISIPKEIVDFINEQHKSMRRNMDDMVRLCFEDFDTLRVRFGDEEFFNSEDENEGEDLSNNEEIEHDGIERMRIKKMRRFNYEE